MRPAATASALFASGFLVVSAAGSEAAAHVPAIANASADDRSIMAIPRHDVYVLLKLFRPLVTT